MFLSIAKANARISELEAELKASTEILESAEGAEEQITALQLQLDELKTDFTALSTERDNLQASVDKASADLKDANEKIASLEAEAKTADTKAADILAATGVEADELPKPEAEEASPEAIHAQFASMEAGPERSAFFQKHRKALLG